MIDPVIKELLHNTAATNVAYNDACRAAIEQGRIIGRRDMKPLIRELVAALKKTERPYSPDEYPTEETLTLFARAREVLEND